jgi:hypothetical protein
MPEVNARAIGVPVMFGKMYKKAIPGMLNGLLTALILVIIVLSIVFRSIKIAMLSMIPNIWPIIMVYGILGISGYVVDIIVAVVGMITFGIAVDDTIHFIIRFQNMHKKGLSVEDAIREVYRNVGNALVFTTVILVVGFGILAFSNYSVNVNMGILVPAILIFALFGDLVLLPVFITMGMKKSKPEIKVSLNTKKENDLKSV